MAETLLLGEGDGEPLDITPLLDSLPEPARITVIRPQGHLPSYPLPSSAVGTHTPAGLPYARRLQHG